MDTQNTDFNADLLAEIAAFCAKHRLSPTKFGALAVQDPAFVTTLKRGRDMGRKLERRMRVFMADMDRRASLIPHGIGSADE
jgi:hypothetical protein